MYSENGIYRHWVQDFKYFSWQFWNIKFKFRFTATTFFKTGFIWNQTLVALYLFRAFHIEPMSHFEHLFHCCMPPTSRLVLNWLKVHQAWDCLLSKSMIFSKNDNAEDEDDDDWWQLATLARDTCWAWGRLGVRAEQPVPRKQLLYTPTILRDTVAHLAHSSYFILLGTG